MSNPVSYPDNTTLLALQPNLDIGDIADPALRLAAFNYIYSYLQTLADGVNSSATLTHVGSNGTSQHALVDNVNAGFMSPADFNKLAGITVGLVASYAIAADIYLTFGGRYKQGYNTSTDSFDTLEY